MSNTITCTNVTVLWEDGAPYIDDGVEYTLWQIREDRCPEGWVLSDGGNSIENHDLFQRLKTKKTISPQCLTTSRYRRGPVGEFEGIGGTTFAYPAHTVQVMVQYYRAIREAVLEVDQQLEATHVQA